MANDTHGVVTEFQKRVKALEQVLVERGKAQQKAVEAAVERLGKTAEVVEIRKRIQGLAEQSGQVQSRLLSAVGVASRQEVATLEHQLAELSKKVEVLVTKNGAPSA